MLPPSSTTNNSNQFNPPSFNTFTNTDLPLPVPPPPPYTNLTGNYPSNNTNLTGIYPTNNTNLTGNYPANNTNLTGNYPTNNTNLTGNYRTNNANLMRNYPSNNTNLSATYLLDNTHGKRNFTLNMNIKRSITHVTNNTHSTRNYPSTATCPSVMPLDDFPRMQNGAYVTQPSTSQIGNIKLQNPVFSGKLVGGKDDPNQSFISSTNQGSGNFSFRQNENQSPSFPLLTSLLSPGASTSSPNGGRILFLLECTTT
uniref:Uncharacterized protein n=1 Tax=Strigamia maritima TaxID=126957 RepID=T1JMU5_STRMM